MALVAAVAATFVGVAILGQVVGRGTKPEIAAADSTAAATARLEAAGLSPTVAPARRTPMPPAGTPPPRAPVAIEPVPGCPPGSTPDTPGPASQARPRSELIRMAFDRGAAKIVALAVDSADESVETWTFDVCSNTWTQMHPAQEPDASDGPLVFDVDSGVAITAGWRTWAYDLAANTWTAKGVVPMTGGPPRAMVYDPVSGLVVAEGNTDAGASTGIHERGPLGIWTYDVERDAWNELRVPGATDRVVVPDNQLLAFDASVDRIAAYDSGSLAGGRTWLLDLRTGTWSRPPAPTPNVDLGAAAGGELAYDEATRQTVLLESGVVGGYDAAEGRWETVVARGECQHGPTHRTGHAMVYDPVNERLVVYGGVQSGLDWADWAGGRAPDWYVGRLDDVVALDAASGSLRTLVEPTVRYAACPLPASTPVTTARPRSTTGSPLVPVAGVVLRGGPFFVRATSDQDVRRCAGLVVEPGTVADGRFLERSTCWDEGAVWWEEGGDGAEAGSSVEVHLAGRFRIDAAIVQADDNDSYLVSYLDAGGEWKPLWTVPFASSGGMQTRPNPADDGKLMAVPSPVTTDALRLQAVEGDGMYAVSEIQVFGVPAADVP